MSEESQEPSKSTNAVPSAAVEPASKSTDISAPGPDPAPRAAASHPAGPENQRARWMKYGGNVALTGVVVILLAGLVIWLAQAQNLHIGKTRFNFRKTFDVTSDASLSLKPQTLSVLGDLKEPIKLVSLYPKLKQDKATTEQDYYTPVVDLLDEYRKKGHNVELEVIDPVNEPAKLDHWIGEVKEKYGSNTKSYRDLLSGELPKTLTELKTQATGEVMAMKKLIQQHAFDTVSEEQQMPFRAAFGTVSDFPEIFEQLSTGAQDELKKQFPDYKLFTSSLKTGLTQFSSRCGQLKTIFDKQKDDKDLPEPIRKYAAESLPHYEQMKKTADALVEKINKLGELKLDEVRKNLFAGEEGEAPPPAIVVMGPTDIKLINFTDVWKSGNNTRMMGPSTGPVKLRFAGEQQTTSAIIALSQAAKQKVCFVRAGGQPKLLGNMMRGGGELSDIGAILKSYNFDVSEKDVTRDSSPPPQNQMPPPPEPGYDEIKDAVWVVISESQMSQFGPTPPSPMLAEKLKEHLDQGGSAICLINFHGDALAAALKDWGVEVKPEVIAVHEPIDAPQSEGDDFIETVRRQPPIFILDDYGDSVVTSSLRSLDGAFVPLCIVGAPQASRPADVTVTSILPIPQEPRSWGETDLGFLQRRDAPPPTFDPATDTAAPIFGGAIAEKKGKGRLVVIGCEQFLMNELLEMPDPKLARQKVVVSRFPANGELFSNSIFWLSHQDRMIALSPAAMDAARIQSISPGLLNFWRVWIVLLLLPLLAIASGFVVYQTRRA